MMKLKYADIAKHTSEQCEAFCVGRLLSVVN